MPRVNDGGIINRGVMISEKDKLKMLIRIKSIQAGINVKEDFKDFFGIAYGTYYSSLNHGRMDKKTFELLSKRFGNDKEFLSCFSLPKKV
jgi:hypothetical protein